MSDFCSYSVTISRHRDRGRVHMPLNTTVLVTFSIAIASFM